MSMYNYDIVYGKCSLMCHVDALSRLPLAGSTNIKTISIKMFNFSEDIPIKIDEIAKSTKEDPILSIHCLVGPKV